MLHDPEWIGRALDGFEVERADRVAHPSTPEHGGTGTAIDSLVVAAGQAARSTSCTVMIWSRR